MDSMGLILPTLRQNKPMHFDLRKWDLGTEKPVCQHEENYFRSQRTYTDHHHRGLVRAPHCHERRKSLHFG